MVVGYVLRKMKSPQARVKLKGINNSLEFLELSKIWLFDREYCPLGRLSRSSLLPLLMLIVVVVNIVLVGCSLKALAFCSALAAAMRISSE